MGSDTRRDITTLLLAWRGGDDAALAQLMPLVYRQLRDIGGHLLRRERSEHTLETSALVHEAYMRLIDLERIGWKDRAHFFAMSARIMRRVLVDHARHRNRDKRSREVERLESSELNRVSDEPPSEILAIHEGLRELARHDTELAQIVELRFFGGLGREEIAVVIGLSSATVTRRWYVARAWLGRYLAVEGP